MDNVPENKKAPRIISPKRLIVHDTILARFFRGKMDTTWTEHGQHMDRAWTKHGQNMDMLKKVDLKEFIWVFLTNLVFITFIGGKGIYFTKKM